MANGNGDPSADYATARTIGGLALIGVAVAVALIDALRTDVTISDVQFFLILGSGLLLLGVRGLERFIKP